MSVRVVEYADKQWEVDVRYRLPNGQRSRERRVLSGVSKSAAARWGQERERHLLQHGPTKPKKEVPTLAEFKERFMNGYAKANRQKPSGIAAKEMIIRVHLVPFLGHKRLDAITNEDVQRLKSWLRAKAAKTVNNVLTVLNVMLKTAVAWGVIEQVACTVKLLPVAKGSTAFYYDFEEYERLVSVASAIDWRTELIVLLGGEAGLRCGEMIALEWTDVDLTKRQLCVRHSDWNGQVNSPKGGRVRYVPMTIRLASALRQHRHLRSSRVLCSDDGTPLTRQMIQNRMRLASRRANVRRGVHILRHTFCSHLAMRGAPVKAIQELAGHAELTMTQRYMHLSPSSLDAAIQLLDASGIHPGRGGCGEAETVASGKSNG
jgi:integrase